MAEFKEIKTVNPNFLLGRFIKYILLALFLATILVYCWIRVHRAMNAGDVGAATAQHVNSNGAAGSNMGGSDGSITSITSKTSISALQAIGAVRDYSVIPDHGRYQKNLQQLNESTQLGEQDELSRLSSICGHRLQNLGAYKPTWDARRQAYVSFAPDKKSIVWDSQAPERAVTRLQQSCQFLNSPPLETDQMYARDSVLRGAAYLKLFTATKTSADLQTQAGQDALRVMVREGLYDHLKEVLSTNLRFDRIYADAPFMQSKLGPMMLDPMMLTLTLCRLGQDCGEGSIAANYLCGTAAVCGGSVEDAILRDAYQLGYDVNLLSQHINEIVAKLQAGNFQDLKPKESFEQMIKRILRSFGLGDDKKVGK